MDMQPDRIAAIVEQRCKDKPHVDYDKDISAWDFIDRKVSDIIDIIDPNINIARIYSISITNHVLRIEYSTVRDLETNYRRTIVCDSAYLGMEYYDIRSDWEAVRADFEARQKEIENEKARRARYRYYLRLRSEFDPDFIPPEDY